MRKSVACTLTIVSFSVFLFLFSTFFVCFAFRCVHNFGLARTSNVSALSLTQFAHCYRFILHSIEAANPWAAWVELKVKWHETHETHEMLESFEFLFLFYLRFAAFILVFFLFFFFTDFAARILILFFVENFERLKIICSRLLSENSVLHYFAKRSNIFPSPYV